MNRRIILTLLLLVISSVMIGCIETREKAPLSTPEIKTAIDTRETIVILFFYDPSMGTSQQQLEILSGIKQNYSDSVILLPYAVDNPDSFDAREGYRVKTTPTTIIIDDEGYIEKTFTKIAYETMIEDEIQQAMNR